MMMMIDVLEREPEHVPDRDPFLSLFLASDKKAQIAFSSWKFG